MVLKPCMTSPALAALVWLLAGVAELAAKGAVVELAVLAWAAADELPLSVRDLDLRTLTGASLSSSFGPGLLELGGDGRALLTELFLQSLQLLLHADSFASLP